MRYLVASDIHGSETYCQKLLERVEIEKPDTIVILGDILYHGPRNELPLGYNPKKVIKLLNEYQDKILAVRGNCDAEVDQMVLEFPIMADYAIMEIGEHRYFATHGHIYNEEKLPPLKIGDILLCGHTHIAVFNDHKTYYYVNPGSVSIPKAGEHSYILIENDDIYFKDLDGNVFKKVSLKNKKW